jgi:catechol 2,3-dioxygenase-like lactoylglutathione lyase family enzyme
LPSITVAAIAAAEATVRIMFTAERLDHVGFTASDLDGLARWYETVFGMRRVHADAWPDVDGGHPLVLCAGSVCIALFRERDGVAPRASDPADPNEHVALALDRANFEQAQSDLTALGITYEVWDHGICESLYFEDPEGHQIELTSYR